ncbi:two-component regulator propeller domain-containing protein [Lysobacter solisilvae (ex Woo and Kim 2020)]|uniref:histidine kinase n=1 Tax=Agrilutibacter terrestris TaxID=2865112 RepID=A0A7H0FYT8_9GAMM|nr:two-component regulator propeller domain-containing protein [Lysobacter terrestris]QNP41204.1 response regulator [Lysobacter terrestris]
MAAAGKARAALAASRRVRTAGTWLLALFVAGLATFAHAGLPETPRLRQFTVADGLPSNRINGVAEDRAGYLWIATSDGLVRHDGVDFRTWRVEQGLHDNFVWSVHVDARNRVWFGTHQAGIGVFDAQRGRFNYYNRGNTPAMASDDVWSVASTRDGATWFGTADAGLYRIAADGKAVTRFMPRAGDPRSLPHASVGQLVVAPDGTLWIGTQGGAARWTGKDFQRVPTDALNSPVVNGLSADRDGTVWIGTPEGVSVRRPDGRYSRSPWAALADGGKVLQVLRRDRSGLHWFDIPAGLGFEGDGRIEPVPLYSSVANGPVRPLWIGVHEDREGGLWFVSYNSGLWYLPANWRRFSVLSRRPDAPESPANAHVRGIAPAGNGSMWLVGTGGTLDRLDPESGVATHVARNVGDGYVLAGVFEDRRGQAWVSWQEGVARIDPASGGVTRWVRDSAEDATLFGEARFAQTDDGTLWLATERGVQQRDEDGRVLASFPAGQGGLPHDFFIEQVGRGPDGALWLAGSGGLLMWNAGARRFEAVPGGPPRHVFGFAAGENGRMWLARFGAVESYRWDGARLAEEAAIDARAGFPALEPSGLVVDLTGRLWLTSVRGLIRVDPADRSVRIFGVHDGLPGQEFADAPVVRPGDGRILAGSAEGLVIFDPAAMKDRGAAPRLVIESIDALRGDDKVAFAPDGAIAIAHDDRDIRFVARLLSFNDAHSHAYRFRLDGYDNSWVQTGGAGERVFSRLKPGRYRLQVQGRAADNLWSPVQTVAFAVQPPWWRTWWAMALLACAGVALLALLADAYRTRLRRRHAWQMAQQKRDLAEQASHAKTRFLATLGHEVRTPMTGVLGMSELLLSTPLNPQQRGYVGAIRGAGEHLLRLVNDALDLARIESDRLDLADEPFDLHALMEELAALVGPLARQRGLAFAMAIGEDTPRHLRGDAARVRQILLNLLGNAVKFTEHGKVTLAVAKRAEEGVCFEVADTGPGLNAEQKSRLFRRFEQAEGVRTSARYGGSGLGLAISQELAAAMGGRIEIDSAPGEGTRFSVSLPLAAAAAATSAAGGVAPEAGMPAVADGRRSLSLLLVEDDPTVADVLVGLLRLQGHHVVHVAHGLAALAAVVTTPFDAALLDLDLPGMDGLALARQLRIQGFAPPLIAVTARADAGAEPEALEAGFDHFIRKPMTLAMLAALLERAVPMQPRAVAEREVDPSLPVAF